MVFWWWVSVVVELGVVVGWLSFFVVDGGGLWGWRLSFFFCL